MQLLKKNSPYVLAALAAANAKITTGHAQTNTPTLLSPVVVTEKRVPATPDQTYTTPQAQTATWTDTPIVATPMSIQVIPLQVIQDQGVDRVKDVYRNVSGVMPVKSESSGIQFENAYIRGFSQRMYVDGLCLYTCPPLDLSGIQQIEVLKGPASSLYGAMEAGGMINVVPRQPEFTPHTTISGGFGSYNFYRGELDTTGPINPDLAYRFTASYEDSDSFRDFLHKQALFIGPSMTWRISDQTQITTWLWYQNLDRPVDPGAIFNFAGQPVGPISRNLAGPYTDQHQPIDDVVLGIHLDHQVNASLKWREKFIMHYFDSYIDAIRFGSATAANKVSPYYDNSSFNNLEFDLVSDGLWQFELGPTEQEVLFGVELSRSDYYYDRLTDNTLAPIDLYNPVYPIGPFHPLPGVAQQNTLTQGVGGFLQDEIKALDGRLHLLLGGRVDYVDQYYLSWSNGLEYRQNDTGFSGRAGLLYDVTPWLAPYASVSRSFNPNTAGSNATFDGTPLDPTTGLQYEGGFKVSLFNKRLLLTTAVYEITKDNVPVRDTANTGYFLNGGTLRSRGVELDVLGQITPELQVVGNYSFDRTKVIESNTLPVGSPFVDIPEHAGSLWVKYTFRTGALQNLGAGLGVFACSDRSGNNAHTFDVSGFTRLDAGVWYTYTLPGGQQIKAQINVFNLTDETYYESGVGQPGTPLSALGKISFTF